MAGRRPKPTALKELQGARVRNRRNEAHPDGIPSCPKHLDKVAKAEWRLISKQLVAIGLLTSIDRTALAAYCAAYSRWVTAEDQVQKFGAVLKSPKSGYPIQNPYLGIANTAVDQMRKFATEFGMTPASRSRINVDQTPPGADPFTEFMNSIGAEDMTSNESSEEVQSESFGDSTPVLP